MRKIFLFTLALCLLGCATPKNEGADDLDVASAQDDTKRIISGSFSSPAWVNEKFTGSHFRRLEQNRLSFSLEQFEHGGGWDTGVASRRETEGPLGDVPPEREICFAYDLSFNEDMPGKWWVGPKVSVNWAAMTDASSTDEWYENYVVEWANQSPSELEADLFDFFDAEFLGESEIEGSTYRHIRLRYQSWWQFWSIRQEYRPAGRLPLAPIFQAWKGIPRELIYNGVKANIETHNPVSGTGTISAFVPDLESSLALPTYCNL